MTTKVKVPSQPSIIYDENTFGKRYKLLGTLGKGSYSTVLKCKDRSTGKKYACKRLNHKYSNWARVNGVPEINTLRKLPQHPNLLQVFEIHFDPRVGRVSIIFEIMDMNLLELISSRKKLLPEERVRCMMFQLIRGLRHLHKHGIFHRDIKPENILIQRKSNKHEEIVKVADLGSVKGLFMHPPHTAYISTRWYRSPECLLTSGHYGVKMDIWAVGCVFCETLTLRPLFPGTTELDQIDKIHTFFGPPPKRCLKKFFNQIAKSKMNENVAIKSQIRMEGIQEALSELESCHFGNGDSDWYVSETDDFINPLNDALPPHLSKSVRDLLRQLLQYDPDLRITAHQALNHEYFSDLKEAAKLALITEKQNESAILEPRTPSPSVSIVDDYICPNTTKVLPPRSLVKQLNFQRLKLQSSNASTTCSVLSTPRSFTKERSKENIPKSVLRGKFGDPHPVKCSRKSLQSSNASITRTCSVLSTPSSYTKEASEENVSVLSGNFGDPMTGSRKDFGDAPIASNNIKCDKKQVSHSSKLLHVKIGHGDWKTQQHKSNVDISSQTQYLDPRNQAPKNGSLDKLPNLPKIIPQAQKNKKTHHNIDTAQQLQSKKSKEKRETLKQPEIKQNKEIKPKLISSTNPPIKTKTSKTKLKSSDPCTARTNNSASTKSVPEKSAEKTKNARPSKAQPAQRESKDFVQRKAKSKKRNKHLKSPKRKSKTRTPPPFEDMDDQPWEIVDDMINFEFNEPSFRIPVPDYRRRYYPSDVYMSSDEETAKNILSRCDNLITNRAILFRKFEEEDRIRMNECKLRLRGKAI